MLEWLGSRLGAWKWNRSTLGQALQGHTQEFFGPGSPLSSLSGEAKRQIVGDFMEHVFALQQSPDPRAALRHRIVECALALADLQVLCMTEDERQGHHVYGRSPYISGQLHRHIRQAARSNEDLASFMEGEAVTDEELIGYCKARAAVGLYYANGFNMVRVDNGDGHEWYRALIEAQAVTAEQRIRTELELPSLIPDGLAGALPYTIFFEYVLGGHEDPLSAWRTDWPDRPLAG